MEIGISWSSCSFNRSSLVKNTPLRSPPEYATAPRDQSTVEKMRELESFKKGFLVHPSDSGSSAPKFYFGSGIMFRGSLHFIKLTIFVVFHSAPSGLIPRVSSCRRPVSSFFRKQTIPRETDSRQYFTWRISAENKHNYRLYCRGRPVSCLPAEQSGIFSFLCISSVKNQPEGS